MHVLRNKIDAVTKQTRIRDRILCPSIYRIAHVVLLAEGKLCFSTTSHLNPQLFLRLGRKQLLLSQQRDARVAGQTSNYDWMTRRKKSVIISLTLAPARWRCV